MKTIRRNYGRVLAAMSEVWAIQEAKLQAIADVVSLRMAGLAYDAEEIKARIGERTPALREVRGSVAVLPINGVIAQKMNLVMKSSGGTSTEEFGRTFDAAVRDPGVGAIVLNVDSPGGSTYGVQELSSKIHSARGSKPIVAVANSFMASAAYWIASSADQIVVTPSGDVGSIGVLALHEDASKAAEKSGVRYTIVRAGKFKAEGNSLEPLGDEALAFFQRRVDEVYAQFTADVARNRGTTPAAVRNGYGQGRAVGAEEAVQTGLADRIGTLEDVVAELAGAKGGTSTRRAEEESRRRAIRMEELR